MCRWSRAVIPMIIPTIAIIRLTEQIASAYDVALEWNDAKRTCLFYHQHPYEDATGLAFQNFPDGLRGLRLLRKPNSSNTSFQLQRIVTGFLQTTDHMSP